MAVAVAPGAWLALVCRFFLILFRGSIGVYRGYIGLYRGSIGVIYGYIGFIGVIKGIMEKKLETTVMGLYRV